MIVLLFIARAGASIPLLGLNPLPLENFMTSKSAASGGIMGPYNMFTGGALLKGAILGLGIMPYASASISMQLLEARNPSLARLQHEGEIGRQKITQYTTYLTVHIYLIEGCLLLMALANSPDKLFYRFNTNQFGNIAIQNSASFSSHPRYC
jgi:preprotein translocase subunit SecY